MGIVGCTRGRYGCGRMLVSVVEEVTVVIDVVEEIMVVIGVVGCSRGSCG